MTSRTPLTVLLIAGLLLAVLIQITPDSREEVLPTPNIPQKDAIGTAGYSARFHFPAEHVWHILTDFSNYHQWSTRVPKVDFKDHPLRAGSVGTITAALPGKEPTDFPIEVILIDYRTHVLAWAGVIPVPAWLLVAERVQQVVELPDQPGWCEYRSWDSWKGPLAYVMQWTYKKWVQENTDFFGQEMQIYINSEDT